MSARLRLSMIVGLGGLYLAVLGFLCGVVVERIRFDLQRTATVTRLTEAEERMRARLMEIEHGTALRAKAGRVVTSTIDLPPSP